MSCGVCAMIRSFSMKIMWVGEGFCKLNAEVVAEKCLHFFWRDILFSVELGKNFQNALDHNVIVQRVVHETCRDENCFMLHFCLSLLTGSQRATS